MASIYFEDRINITTAATPSEDGFLIAYDLDGILKQKDDNGNITPVGGGSINNFQFGNSCYRYDIQFASQSIIPIEGQAIFDEQSEVIRIHEKDAVGNDVSVYLDTIFNSNQLGIFWSEENGIIDDTKSGSLYIDQSRTKVQSVTCSELSSPGSSEDPGLTQSPYNGVITGISFSAIYSPTIDGLKAGGSSATPMTIYLDPVFIYTEADELSSDKFTASVFRRDSFSFVNETTDESLMAYANTHLNKSQFSFDNYFYSNQSPRIFRNESLTSDAPSGYYIFESEYIDVNIKKNAVHYLGDGQFEDKFPGWNYVPATASASPNQSCMAEVTQLVINKFGNYYEIPYFDSNLSGNFKPDSSIETNLCFESMSLNYFISQSSASEPFTSGERITTVAYNPNYHMAVYVDDESSIILKVLGVATLEYDNNTNTITFTKENGQIDSFILEVDSKTTADVTANIAVGAIKIGDTISSGTSIQELVEKLLLTTYNPTFVNPTFGLSDSVNNIQEVGNTINVPLTFNFNRGSIRGDIVSGTWNETAIQNPRAGSSISYTIDGNNQTGNTFTVLNHEVILGSNTFQGTVTYEEGPQPKDSNGDDYDSPFSSGTSPTRTTSFTGYFPYFWGTSNTHISDPFDVITEIESNNSNKVVANSGGTLTLNAGTSIQFVWLAVPFSFPLKTEWYDTALVNGNIGAPGASFDENGDRWVAFDNSGSGYSIDSPNGYWTGIKYIIYLQKPSLGGAGLTNPVQFRV